MNNAWKVKKLNDIANFSNGKGINAKDEGEFPVYGANGQIGYTDEYKFEDGAIIGRVGAYCGATTYEEGKFWASDNTIVANSIKGGSTPTFLYYLLKNLNLNNYAHGSAQPLITQTFVKNMEVTVPEVNTQNKIAKVIRNYDSLIQNNNKRINILEEMAQSLYTEWFVNFRFPSYEKVKFVDSELGKIPESWRVSKISETGKVHTGKTPSKKRNEYYGYYMPFIKTPDMHNGIFVLETSEYLSESGANSQKALTLPASTICVSCIGTAGIVAITTEPSQTNQQINSIVLDNEKHLEFMYFTLCGLREIIRLHGGTGATMTNLSKSKFSNLTFILPDNLVINNFNSLMSPFFKEIRTLSQKNAALIKTRDLLIPKLISGEIDVSNLDIEVEEDDDYNLS